MGEDIVNPKRYTHTKIECWDFWIKAGLDPLIASAVKYVWRYKHKNGLEDLKKAKIFLRKAIDELYKNELYHSYKFYLLTRNEVEDLSDNQYMFMRNASHTTGTTHYVYYCEQMIDLVDDMMKEYESNND